jgi:glycosyltransferase involved in cell wall biosynthesis
MAQTYNNWELLIIDDGSSDNTVDMIKTCFNDSRIHVLKNKGVGVCEARNCGLHAANGELIAYLDSDNTWTPEYLELMLYEMERSDADCAYAVLKCIDKLAESTSDGIFYRQQPFDYEKLKLYNFIDLNVFIHRKRLSDKLGGFDVDLERMVDWDLILRYTRNRTVSFANFIGAIYDNGPSPDRITNSKPISYLNVVRNKHWIDWKSVIEDLPTRNANLVSIVICVYNEIKLTEICLTSLFMHEAGEEFEVILVNNGSDSETVKALESWCKRYSCIKLINNPENFNFALGNNIGFAASRGSRVVFLNNDTEVTPEWLRALVRPLADPEIKGSQPKLLYPDGSIQCVGVVFSDRSPIGYPIYAHQPGDFEPTQKSRNFSAITAACCAFRAEDFARVRGFDPIFTNGQEDIDLCLRIGGGKPVFRYVADSTVFHREGKTKGRSKNIKTNRKIFHDRWKDIVHADDIQYYEEDGIHVNDYDPDNANWAEFGCAVWRPRLNGLDRHRTESPNPAIDTRTIAIKIACPRSTLKDHWGDYHFAVALASAFARKGIRARIDFLESWGTAARDGDINLVLRGLSRFHPQPGTINLMWMISHPDKVSIEELDGFDHVFVASTTWAEELSKRCTVSMDPLLQCTDSCRFHPDAFDQRARTDALFVANSRKILRPIVREAIAQDLEIDIFGEMWKGLAPDHWIKAEKIDNVDLPRYYASANVVLNDHWESMREHGFVSNRVFDVLACGAPLVTDSVPGMPQELESRCHFFGREAPLSDVIKAARRDPCHVDQKARALAEYVRREHSFDARVAHLLTVLTQLISS